MCRHEDVAQMGLDVHRKFSVPVRKRAGRVDSPRIFAGVRGVSPSYAILSICCELDCSWLERSAGWRDL